VAAAVRQALRERDQSHRALDERLAIRFPKLAARQARAVASLPPTSRLRRAIIRRTVELGIAAYNRRDLAAVAASWHRDFEYVPGREWVGAGLAESSYRGLTGYRQYVAATAQVWGLENQLSPVAVVDRGDRIVLLADGRMRAQASGIPLSESFALVVTIENGQPIRLEEYYDHAEALRAAGVD
jgi:ketosteroid isomerase-like protein